MENSENDIREDMADKIRTDIHGRIGRRHGGRVWVPLGLVVVGGLLLAASDGCWIT